MKTIRLKEIEGNSVGYLGLLALLGAFVLAGLGSAYYMEHHGHWVTGMNNQIVWGLPHVFAVFLIVAASGALNIASISSVFDKKFYKPLAPLSAMLSLALLIGGLMILVLDLGHPDRLIVAMTYYNFKSIFAWNMILYNGFFLFTGVYLWFMLDRNMKGYTKYAGFAAFIWRLILTTGTGAIFGFIVARTGYNMAMLAPMFIIMSFAFGLAIYILVLMAAYKWTDRVLGDAVIVKLRKLLGVFVAAVLYFVVVYHLTNLYMTNHHDYEAFILLGTDGGENYSRMFWIGQIALGSLIPLALIFAPGASKCRMTLSAASILVILGGLAQMYTLIIGGQAFPLEIFPGMEVLETTFFDGVTAQYMPTLAETMLGLSGIAVALIIVALSVKVLNLLPETLDDTTVDPHHKADQA
ncbi:MAG: polysulfide reductase NrfD [Gammaproteobacteria bacterium]|nr:polysulfide reductase NrfD [Gammaproteobacteria bacterium]